MTTARLPIAARRHTVVTAMAAGVRSACPSMAGPVVLGASGGVDSTAMLLAMQVLSERDEFDIAPVAVHVNHHLRDDAADDAEHVQRCCEAIGMACEVIDVHPDRGGEEARVHRYEALLDVAVSHGAGDVVVAHHAEDQLETIIAAIGRGAGPEGMAGMAPSRPLGDGVRLVRPLLSVSKGQLQSMCETSDMAWREDPTNVDPSTVRGLLRRDVLPVLELLWPGAAQRSAVNAPLVRAAAEALRREASVVFGAERSWTRSALRAVGVAVRSTGLRQALMASGLGADEIDTTRLVETSEAIDDRGEHARRFEFNATTAILIDANTVSITREAHDA
jgi:tRNA(Ile)-lysidine synthetase-like protein